VSFSLYELVEILGKNRGGNYEKVRAGEGAVSG